MNKTTTSILLLAGACLAAAPEASAQAADSPTIFVSVNVGVQAHTPSFTTSDSFTIYEEGATIASTQGTDGGPLFDVGVGYYIRDNLAVGLGVSRVADTASAAVAAVIPHPVFFDRPLASTTTVEDLDRREVGVHLQLMWFPDAGFLPEGTRLALVVGPSFFRVEQDLVTGATVAPQTQVATPTIANESASAVGVNVGIDVSYAVMPRIGVGAFVRYAGASFDLPSAPDDKAGGFQAGAGVRIGFWSARPAVRGEGRRSRFAGAAALVVPGFGTLRRRY
jgi:hypothetical protein